MFFVCLFVCLFVCCGISSHSRIVHSYVYVIFAGEVLQTLMTFARHSWPLSSDGSLACHTYCDTGHPFTMLISEDPSHSHLLLRFWQWRCHNLILGLRTVTARSRTPNLPLVSQTPNPLCNRRSSYIIY